jgi:DNA-binding response OmpR family regulator
VGSPSDDEGVLSSASSSSGQRRLLVIADSGFFEEVTEVAAPLGFRCVHVPDLDDVVAKVAEEKPAAIVVDLGSEPSTELRTLQELTQNPRTAQIPLHVVGRPLQEAKALSLGVVNYMKKPVDASTLREALQTSNPDSSGKRCVLVVDADPENEKELRALLAASDVETIVASTASEAMAVLQTTSVTCLITDLDLPDAPGHELLRSLSEAPGPSVPSVIVHTDRDVSEREEEQGKLALWNALRAVRLRDNRLDGLDLDKLASRANKQFELLEDVRLRLAQSVLANPRRQSLKN